MYRPIFVIVTALFLCSFSGERRIIYKDSSYPLEERVEDLLSRMTIDEKVAQMRMFHANKGITLGSDGQLILTENVKERLKNGIAGIKNPGEHLSPLKAAELNNQLQKYIIDNNRLGIPGLFVTESYNGVDAEGSTHFGRPISSAASFNTDLVRRIWDVVGREARLRGMHMCHSPEADIVRDPRFGRMSETFGEDTYLTTEMVVNAVKGVQGDYVGLAATHIGAVTKHFAGYGQVSGGKNFASIEISPRTLIDEIYPPFEAAVNRGKTLGIMASHGDINGVASHASHELLTNVLRNQWGFNGYVVSDANDIARLHSFMKVAETPEHAVTMSLTAGMDVDLYSDSAYALLPAIVNKEPFLEKNIDEAVRRVLRTKFILGLFDNPFVDVNLAADNVRNAKSLKLAQEADLESIILLKNDRNTLPLNKNTSKKIALLGPLLNEETKQNFANVAGKNVSFTAEKGFNLTDEHPGIPKLSETSDEVINQMVKIAEESDVIILFLGGDEFTAKEAFFNNALGDRATIDLLGRQDELLHKIKALGKTVIVAIKHRRTLSINEVARKADAILDCWDMSEFGDESLAKIIFGDVVPSGKSPVTIPRTIGQLPFHYSQKEINYKKEYLFIESGPLYPFGYGLSYSTFEYLDLHLSTDEISPTDTMTVSVKIKNSGKYFAKEVVQLYIKDIIGSVVRPEKELKGFEKVSLKPGEIKEVVFKISSKALEFTGISMVKGVEAGEYEVTVGGSSHEGLSARFRIRDSIN